MLTSRMTIQFKGFSILIFTAVLSLAVKPFPAFTAQAFGRTQAKQAISGIFVSSVNETPTNPSNSKDDNYDDEMNDVQLLRETPKAQLVDLCEQFRLSTKGTKADLLNNLRNYAKEQGERQRRLLLDRKKKVEEGGEDEREKFEIVGESEIDELGGDEDEFFVYYQSTDLDKKTETKSEKKDSNKGRKVEASEYNVITAPPPPPVEPDENGERVVTVYSTSDQNDLTGVAAAQPGQASNDAMFSDAGYPTNAPWDSNNPQKAESTTSDLDAAKESVSDLVQSLLAMSGAPAFQQDADELSFLGVVRQSASYSNPEGFVGFDPTKVPTDMLTSASKSLRAGRGKVLRDVLREFELRAIGHDGSKGDDMEKGGGHYRQVSKVRSFLEGYRRAEVRRLARETATLLLDKLVSDGIEGLDITLASMTRSSDDTSDEAGELNDSLLDYLNDIVRQQEKKVEQMVDSVKKIAEFENSIAENQQEDHLEKLWTVDSEGGERVETFDPNAPENRKALQEEFKKEERRRPQAIMPKSAPEKLLLLLKLLRERVKTEAAFSHDEKARNLRILAYCLNLKSDSLRRELLMKEFGSSLDVRIQTCQCFSNVKLL